MGDFSGRTNRTGNVVVGIYGQERVNDNEKIKSIELCEQQAYSLKDTTEFCQPKAI